MSPIHRSAPGFNLNSLLITVLMLLSGATLRTVFSLSTDMASVTTMVAQHEREINGLDSRLTTSEHEITNLRVRIGGNGSSRSNGGDKVTAIP